MNTTDRPEPPHPPDVRGTDMPVGAGGRPPLVRDPTLAARFIRPTSGPGRRFAGKYPGAVVAAVCLAGLAAVGGVRALSAGGSPAAASTGPAPAPPAGPATSGAATSRTPSTASRTPSTASVRSAAPTSPPTPSRPTPSRRAPAPATAGPHSPGPHSPGPHSPGTHSPGPLTSPVPPGAPAPTALQASAGAALLRNPAIRVDARARRQLLAGRVDVRLTTVLAAVAAQTPLTISSFPPTGGDPPGSPVLQAAVSATDPAAGAAVARALSAQAGDYAVQTTPAARGGQQLVRLRTAGRR